MSTASASVPGGADAGFRTPDRTCHPSDASARATSRPMPRLAPVINATFPLKPPLSFAVIFFSSLCCCASFHSAGSNSLNENPLQSRLFRHFISKFVTLISGLRLEIYDPLRKDRFESEIAQSKPRGSPYFEFFENLG